MTVINVEVSVVHSLVNNCDVVILSYTLRKV